MLSICNVALVTPEGLLSDSSILMDDTILAINPPQLTTTAEKLDGGGRFLFPGFVDTHIHGLEGFDVMYGTEAVRQMALRLPKYGVTAFVPTTVSAEPEAVTQALHGIRAARARQERDGLGARILKAHLEGPYLAPARRGAHRPETLCEPNTAVLEAFADVLGRVTVAPELPGAEGFIRRAVELGIHVNLGHTNADAETCLRALEWGADGFTHVFNAMSGIDHRAPGAAAAALRSGAWLEVIADGIHLHPQLVSMLHKLAHGRVVLITDAMEAAGLPEGRYDLGGLTVEARSGAVRLADGTLAGSMLTMNRAAQNYCWFTGADEVRTAEAACVHPAAFCGQGGWLGSLAVGYAADAVLINADGSVFQTIIGGVPVSGEE